MLIHMLLPWELIQFNAPAVGAVNPVEALSSTYASKAHEVERLFNAVRVVYA